MFITAPERENIKYHLVKLDKYDIPLLFDGIVKDLSVNGSNATKVLVFCRTKDDVRNIYQYFHKKFGKKYLHYKERPYAMFHAMTLEAIKDFILSDFMEKEGVVRVLIATIAFGMGIDCKDLNIILHIGPPSNVENYFQQSGRGGRDGSQVHAIMVSYGKHFFFFNTYTFFVICTSTLITFSK